MVVREMGFARNVSALIALSCGLYYLTSASSLTDDGKWTLIGITFLFTIIWVMLGNRSPRRVPVPVSHEHEVESQDEEEEIVEQANIPEPVTEESLDGATLRERKLAKIKASELERQQLEDSEEDDFVSIEEVEVELEELHTADEYVVEISPESVEDADIEVTVSNRRIQHQEIRERIEKRRRGQLAEIRASTVRMWEEHTAGEDLVAVLQDPNHGQTVLIEPENPKPGHIYGATFVRINDTQILKLRTPLDDGFEEVEKKPSLPPLVGPDGMPLPPLPGMENLPLPPLPEPPTSASGALAALKEEMED
tara:strand:- start:4776 stop:5702 length:927 start_codon:yes stop_codon:yes gene_type:complete